MKPSLELIAATDGKSEGRRASHGQALSSTRAGINAYREADENRSVFKIRICNQNVPESFTA